jgi:hypothetical protein
MALAATTLITTSGNASAVEPPGIQWDHVYSATGVRIYVKEYGDIISVCDTKANGYAAFVEVRDINAWPYNYEMKASGGKGTCKTHRASDGARYNLPEHIPVDLYFDGNSLAVNNEVSFVNDH